MVKSRSRGSELESGCVLPPVCSDCLLISKLTKPTELQIQCLQTNFMDYYQEHRALQVTLPLFFQGSPTLCLYLNNLRGIAKEHLGTSRCLNCFDSPQLEQELECGGPLAACSPEAGLRQLSVWLWGSCCTLQVLGIGLRCGRG